VGGDRTSREHILAEIRRLAEFNGGTSLGAERFESVTGISQSQWSGRYWARWSDAVREAGFEPNDWRARQHDDDALIRILADMTRDLGRFPARRDLQMRRRAEQQFPSDKVFDSRLGSKAEQLAKVLAFASSHSDYADVPSICQRTVLRPPRSKSANAKMLVTGVVYLISMGELYKVGKSNGPGRRSYELGLRLPAQHDLVHVIETDDPSGIAAYWHRRFAANQANGEWFRLAHNDVAAFARRSYM
jgi:hypothetical protein